jgi:hypothetical protein
MYVYIINFVKLCHRYVLMCCSDSMNNYVCGCLCIEVFFENEVNFEFLGMTVTNQNFMHEKIKIVLNSGNFCCYSIRKLLPSHLLSINVKLYKIAILPIVLYGLKVDHLQ